MCLSSLSRFIYNGFLIENEGGWIKQHRSKNIWACTTHKRREKKTGRVGWEKYSVVAHHTCIPAHIKRLFWTTWTKYNYQRPASRQFTQISLNSSQLEVKQGEKNIKGSGPHLMENEMIKEQRRISMGEYSLMKPNILLIMSFTEKKFYYYYHYFCLKKGAGVVIRLFRLWFEYVPTPQLFIMHSPSL